MPRGLAGLLAAARVVGVDPGALCGREQRHVDERGAKGHRRAVAEAEEGPRAPRVPRLGRLHDEVRLDADPEGALPVEARLVR